jgi:protein involved in polysaccharide export with SLBB domain
LAGCSSAGGNRFTLFPEGHPLIEQAKALKAAHPDPLPLPRELDKRVAPPYTVEPGDTLLVQPADLDSPIRFPGDQPVLPDGTINLGRYGQLVVAGKTIADIEAAVRAQIDSYLKDPQTQKEPRRAATANDPQAPAPPTEAGPITVRVVTRQSKVYYVLGEVNAPGAFPLRGNETVLDAILAAGGLNDRASRKNILLSRPTHPDSCRVVLPICYQEITQLGDTSTNYQIAAGDRVIVPSRTCREQLPFHKDEDCPPCGRPQVPCPAPDGSCPAGSPGPAAPPSAWPVSPALSSPARPAPAQIDAPRPLEAGASLP